MEKVEEKVVGYFIGGKLIRLKGTLSEVKEGFLSWAGKAFQEVYPYTNEAILSSLQRLVSDLEKGERYGLSGYHETWPVNPVPTPSNAFLGAFYRLGDTVRLVAIAARLREYWDKIYEREYNLLTRGDLKERGTSPDDPLLRARALAFPKRAPLIEEIDCLRRRVRALKGLLPPSLARPLAKAVRSSIEPKGLRVWDGVALYQEEEARYLVFDGKVYRLEGKAWEIARRILRKRKGTPLERARMAVFMARLGK